LIEKTIEKEERTIARESTKRNPSDKQAGDFFSL